MVSTPLALVRPSAVDCSNASAALPEVAMPAGLLQGRVQRWRGKQHSHRCRPLQHSRHLWQLMQELKLRSNTAWCSHLHCPIALQLKGLQQTLEPLRSGPMQVSPHYRSTASFHTAGSVRAHFIFGCQRSANA